MFQRRSLLFVLAAAVSWSVPVVGVQTGDGNGPFTAAQADAGQGVYTQRCASCHLASLAGSFEAPALTGPNFQSAWNSRSLKELIDLVQRSMPPGAPGSLGEQDTLNVASYLLRANGRPAGAQALSMTTAAATRIGSQSTATAALPSPPRDQAAAAPRRSRGLTAEGTVANYVDVTDAMLRTPDPADWLMVRGNYQAWSYSPLAQITTENVHDLKLAWVWGMADGSNQPAPLVHNGTIYLVHPGNIVQALDGRSGDLIWEYRAGPDEGGPMRNLAIYKDKIYQATTDARVLALDARTGRLIWESRIADSALGFSNSSGPLVANGKVIQGLGGCQRFGQNGCFISAFDAETGAKQWTVDTIARPDTPGGDTWGRLPMSRRTGGETWITGSYDPDLDLTYWGTAQAKPWVPASRGLTVFDHALFTSSTLAIRVNDGKLAWHFQHIPGEAMDMDEVFERVLVDDRGTRSVFSVGKTGILWKLDRKTGAFQGLQPTVFQNIFDRVNPKTGELHYRNDIAEAQIGDWVQGCPSTSGGHNWQAMTFHPGAGLLIIPLTQSCFEISGRRVDPRDGSGGTGADRRWTEMPGAGGSFAKLAAFDAATLQPVWSIEQHASYLTSALSTAGGVVFVGDADRYFHAYEVKTGKELWKIRLGTSVQGFPATFSIGGKQYIAVTTGLGGGSPRRIPALLAHDIRNPETGNALYVFELPDPK